jgi:S-adenosylmethionine:tRNA ribosyltransferase-isomerase
MKTSDFDYELPAERIAQVPLETRDESRLLVLTRPEKAIEHRRFHEIDQFLRKGDLLVFNDSRVIPARLWGRRQTGGKVELLLLRHIDVGRWEALVKPAKRIGVGERLQISNSEAGETWAEVMGRGQQGVMTLRVPDDRILESLGEVPLPPYIHVPLEDPERYQTVYARIKGSAAAPTAGLHFTPQLLEVLERKGIDFAFVTLHVGLDTFRPVRDEDPRDHHIHREYGELGEESAAKISRARQEGRRVVIVGTTTLRLLEGIAAQEDLGGGLHGFRGWIDLYILPGFRFRVTDALITNFHLPRSTLLMLVSAFAGRELIQRAYEEAKCLDYRFFSFGDAMLIL